MRITPSINVTFPALASMIQDEKKTSLIELLEMSDQCEYYVASHMPPTYLGQPTSHDVPYLAYTDLGRALLKGGASALRRLINREVVARLKSRATKKRMLWKSENVPYLTRGLPVDAFRSF